MFLRLLICSNHKSNHGKLKSNLNQITTLHIKSNHDLNQTMIWICPSLPCIIWQLQQYIIVKRMMEPNLDKPEPQYQISSACYGVISKKTTTSTAFSLCLTMKYCVGSSVGEIQTDSSAHSVPARLSDVTAFICDKNL